MFRINFLNKTTGLQAAVKDHFIDAKLLYVAAFRNVPSIIFISEIDATAALSFVRQHLANQIQEILQHAYFDHTANEILFNNTVIVLQNQRIIELGADYCQILYGRGRQDWAVNFVKDLARFRTTGSVIAPATVIGFARHTASNQV